MKEVGLEVVETYVLRRQNTIVQYIVIRLILELCLAVDRQPGMQVMIRWWEHTGLDLGQEEKEMEVEMEEEGEREYDAEKAT